jgi:hypothetical protein
MQVRVISDGDGSVFKDKCNRALADGYKLQGDMAVSTCYDSDCARLLIIYAQMFVKD